jgi:holin-like protein
MLFWLTALLCFQLAGEFLVLALGLSVPGPVAGMAMLFAFLVFRKAVPDELSTVGGALLSHLSLLFVPAGVGIMAHFDVLQAEWHVIAVALVVSTLLSIATTASMMVAIKRWIGLS